MRHRTEGAAVIDRIAAEATRQRARAFKNAALGLFWLGWAVCAFVVAWKLWELKI